MEAAGKILRAALGPAGEHWLERQGKIYSVAAIAFPRWLDKRLADAKARAVRGQRPPDRRWNLVQVESAIACNLKCIMCPWRKIARGAPNGGLMTEDSWKAISRHLEDIASVDFTGGGEPLLQPHLVDWVSDASRAGCETGFLTNGMLLTAEKSSQLMDAGINWLCVSIDGATAEVYEAIRPGAGFGKVCDNLSALSSRRIGGRPRLMINFVLMEANFHQLNEMVHLAAELGVDQVNFKQCDVIRGESGKGFGLFSDKATRKTRRMGKKLKKARRLAKRLKIETTAFAWEPEELPVCAQDPRTNVFIRHDGSVAPCINLAIGGPTTFFNDEVVMPTVHYGNIGKQALDRLWDTSTCRFYRERFAERTAAYETAFTGSDLEASPTKLKEALENARTAMPRAPEGCRVCHYLYNI
jgi:MoaA/NifB/PqqE/SkfB family radical SAM enzyme